MDLEQRVKWAEREDKDADPLEFFREHYDPSTTRSRLAKEDFSLYRILRRRKLGGKPLLDKAIPDFDVEKHKLGKHYRRLSKYGEDALAYYQEHYPGFTRGELEKENPGLYHRLHDDDLIEQVPLVSSRYGDDLLAYYQEHYPGVTRGRLQRVNNGLYQRLRRAKLLGQVPSIYPDYGNDLLAYYREHYQGVTRGSLRRVNDVLYQRLRRAKLLKRIPLRKRQKKRKQT